MKTQIVLTHLRESFRVPAFFHGPRLAWVHWNWHPFHGGGGNSGGSLAMVGAVAAVVLISFLALRGSDSK